MRFFQTLLGSFYSPATYQEARREGEYGLGYSFLLVILTTLVVVIFYTYILHDVVFVAHQGKPALFDDITMQAANQVPVMTLQQGELHTQEPGVHSITLHADLLGKRYERMVVTIDTSGTTTYENMRTPMLITAHEVVMRSDRETKIKSFREVFGDKQGTLVINHALALDMGQRIIEVVHANLIKFYLFTGIFAWIGFIIVLYILRLFMLLALGLTGLAISAAFDAKLTYGQCVKLAGIAFTPIAVINTVALLVATHPVSSLWTFICGVIMLAAAICVSRETPLAPTA